MKTEITTVQEFCSGITFPGRIMFAKLWGSRSHNLSVEDSDYDFLAVYQAPTEDVLSLFPFQETKNGKDPDFEGHEVGKFCQLLLKGNPSIIETLFTDRECLVFSPFWEELAAHRRAFLSKEVLKQYLGYAKGQAVRLQNHQPLHTTGGEYNTKWAYHIVRLCQDALRISKGDVPVIWRTGKERDYLLEIRSGKFSPETIQVILRQYLDEIDVEASKLPDSGPIDFLNDWLLRVRRVR